MSFIPPTSNVVVITSESQTIASGSITITLNIKDAVGLASNSYTMDVTDIGSIEVDYNYIEDISDINEFTINVPRFEFEMREYIKDASGAQVSFVQLMSAITANDLIVAKVDFNAGSDYYYTTREQCEFNYLDRKVKLSMQHPLKYGQTAFGKTWGTQLSSKIVTVRELASGGGGYTNVNAFYTRDLVEQYVNVIADTSNITYNSDFYAKNSLSTVSDLDIDALFIDSDTTADSNFTVATSTVKQVALSDCAIIGNVLGHGFYMPRYSKSHGSTLTSDDFSELELDFSYKNIRNFEIRIQYGDQEQSSNSIYDFQTLNDIGTADVNVDYSSNIDGMAVCEAGLVSNVAAFEFEPATLYPLPAGYEANVVSAFKKIFRITDSANNVDAGVAISGTILGIDKLKPYEYFSVGSGVHPLVNNKDFRPSYLKFNLLDDTIEFEAYEF